MRFLVEIESNPIFWEPIRTRLNKNAKKYGVSSHSARPYQEETPSKVVVVFGKGAKQRNMLA